ncbi:hypothetical protein AB6A40_002909 [Gnathostoma spinigerum]|uniref:Uncharacterized protein n=1 Tax=Gnathostoma spinigerum TaxID=75299 RepID=A0ABD6EIS9_9BILA
MPLSVGPTADVDNQVISVRLLHLKSLFENHAFQMNSVYKLIDPDDKMGFTVVENEDGIFNVEGCGSDFDWIPGLKNSPEVYIGVHHFCKSPSGSFLKVLPPFRHFVPSTYHYHITSPIELD